MYYTLNRYVVFTRPGENHTMLPGLNIQLAKLTCCKQLWGTIKKGHFTFAVWGSDWSSVPSIHKRLPYTQSPG